MTEMNKQIGGSHYTDMKIQPLEYSMANKLNACEHSIVKYVSRHGSKNGLEDLLKAKDMLDKLIEFEYPTPDYTEEEAYALPEQTVHGMDEAGFTRQQIADTLGISIRSVYRELAKKDHQGP